MAFTAQTVHSRACVPHFGNHCSTVFSVCSKLLFLHLLFCPVKLLRTRAQGISYVQLLLFFFMFWPLSTQVSVPKHKFALAVTWCSCNGTFLLFLSLKCLHCSFQSLIYTVCVCVCVRNVSYILNYFHPLPMFSVCTHT
jgi:hypothetical protein